MAVKIKETPASRNIVRQLLEGSQAYRTAERVLQDAQDEECTSSEEKRLADRVEQELTQVERLLRLWLMEVTKESK